MFTVLYCPVFCSYCWIEWVGKDPTVLPFRFFPKRSGCPAPPFRGHVCCQSSPPAQLGALTWHCTLEFRAGGAAVEAAQAALQEASIQAFASPELLPPSIAMVEEVEEKAQHFLTQRGKS